MAPRIDLNVVVQSVIAKNPNASADNLRAQLRNELQDLKRSGQKISPKEFAQANELIGLELAKAQNAAVGVTVAPKVKKATQAIASQQAVQTYDSNIPKLTQNEYDMMQYNKGNALKSRQEAFQKELQEAFNVDKDAVQRTTESSHFVENNRASRRADLIDGVVDKKQQGAATFEEHLEKLSPKEKQAALEESQKIKIEPYVSSKKAKKIKKSKIEANQLEHKRFRNSKKVRNARYCTQNSIMTHDAKKAYNEVLQQANGRIKVNVNTTAPIKSAEESARVFMEHGFKPIENQASKLSKFGKLGIAAAFVIGTIGLITKKNANVDVNAVQIPQQMQQFNYSAVA